MSKELLVAGAIVVVCLGVTAVALVKPKASPATDTTAVAATDPAASDGAATGGYDAGLPPAPVTPLTPSDSFGRDNSTFPPVGADLNPNRPFDSSVLPGASTGGLGSAPLPPPPIGGDLFAPIPPPLPVTPVDTGSVAPTIGGDLAAITSAGGPREHVVKKGETLSDISKQHYGTVKHWRAIEKANQGVAADGLRPGDKLVIPEIAASATPAPATADAGGAALYVVRKNDTFYQIAKRELGDASRYKEIQRLNNLQPDDLREGMKLKLPAKGGAPVAEVKPDRDLPAGARLHTVAKDEYIIDISKKYYGSTKHWREIAKANPGLDPERLKVGQKLVIPARGGGAGAATGAAAAETAAGEGEYVIKAGDTYPRLAERLLGDARKWKEFSAANPGVDPQRLRIGQKIKLPAGASGAGARSEPALPAPTADPIPAPLPMMPTLPAPTAPATDFPLGPVPAADPGAAFPGASAPAPAPGASGFPAPTGGDAWDVAPAGGATPAPGADPWGSTGGTTRP